MLNSVYITKLSNTRSINQC